MAQQSIIKEILVESPLEEVWDTWTTQSGCKTFFAPECKVETRVGGPYVMLFLSDAPAGQRGAEGCEILELSPNMHFAFSWNAPPQYASVRNDEHTRVDVFLYPASESETMVQLQHSGWKDGDEWDQVHGYFVSAWDTVLGRLKQTLESGEAVQWPTAMAN